MPARRPLREPIEESWTSSGLEVSCRESERWLRFRRGAQFDALAEDDLLRVDVMTLGTEGEPYTLCHLVVSRGDLLRAVAAVGDPPYRSPGRREP